MIDNNKALSNQRNPDKSMNFVTENILSCMLLQAAAASIY